MTDVDRVGVGGGESVGVRVSSLLSERDEVSVVDGVRLAERLVELLAEGDRDADSLQERENVLVVVTISDDVSVWE